MGTPQYLSPEQAQGGTATPASDVYSLGVVAFECLAGRRPFVAETPVATALAHLREPCPTCPPTSRPTWPPSSRRAMAKDPTERFADGDGVRRRAARPGGRRRRRRPSRCHGAGDRPSHPGAGRPMPPAPTPTPAPDRRRRPAQPVAGGAAACSRWSRRSSLIVVVVPPRRTTTTTTRPSRHQQCADVVRADRRGHPTEPSRAPRRPRCTIDEDDYVGRDVDEVDAELRATGSRSTRSRVDNPGDEEADTVAASTRRHAGEGDTVTVELLGPSRRPEPTADRADRSPPSRPARPSRPGRVDVRHRPDDDRHATATEPADERPRTDSATSEDSHR